MPNVEIYLVEGSNSAAQKSAFMKRTTEEVVRTLGCPSEDVVVSIIEYKAENVSRAGVSAAERRQGQ